MKMNPSIFREYDIRGVVDEDFDLGFAEQLGRAYVTYQIKERRVHRPRVTLGHDARLSSPDIVKALAKGITASGGSVIHLGLITSPMSYFSTFALDGIDGAIMVTGSHNPPEYNGFKISMGRATIFGHEIQKLKGFIDQADFASGQGEEESFDIFPIYVERYKREFGDLKNTPVVLDCANGAAGIVARRLYEAVGLKPVILYESPDGTFPNHHPDPTVAENLVDLIREVRKTKSLAGFGFDGDADRIGLVDDTGRIILGDEIIALCAKFVLAERPQEIIVGDVKCSDRMFDYIRKYGGKPIMWKTGHSLIKEKIKVEKAPFGGELSGHIFFADRNYGYDDALYAGLRVIEILAKTGKSIGELLRDLPPSFNTPEIRVDTTEEKKHLIVEQIKAHFSTPSDDYTVNLIDGIRVSFKRGWALARASNTQPVLVLRFEADSQSELDNIRSQFNSLVNPLL